MLACDVRSTVFLCLIKECNWYLQVVKRLMERAMPVVPKLNFPVVDVRDVATAHIKAMVTPEAAGECQYDNKVGV